MMGAFMFLNCTNGTKSRKASQIIVFNLALIQQFKSIL